jgi:spermidine/putrescine transport system permease protein
VNRPAGPVRSVSAQLSTEAGSPPALRGRRRWTSYVLPFYVGGVIAYLLVPIAVMILYSFNGSNAHLPTVTFKLQGFTTEWYRTWNGVPGLTPAFYLSLRLALASTAVAAVLGTLLALALARYRFRGKGTTEQILFLNIAAPEIVLGASLLGFFITLNLHKGFPTLFIAHVMFSIAYVTITVRTRLAGFDLTVEQAAQDLGATPWVTFWKVTLPLIFPGILAGALLAFALSIDDFVISNFVAGSTNTFPLWVWSAVKVGIPPQVFVLGTLIFLVGIAFAAINVVLQGRGLRSPGPGASARAR